MRQVFASTGFNQDQVLRIAASLDAQIEHPLAQATVSQAKQAGTAFGAINDLESVTGQGVSGQLDSVAMLLGNSR